jgi:hypothetical protein
VRVVALPQLEDGGESLAQMLASHVLRDAAGHAVEFVLEGAASDAEFEAAARDDVDDRGLRGKAQGMPIRRHGDGRAEPDVLRVIRPMRQHDERVGAVGELVRVVLCGIHLGEPAGLGHRDQLQCLVRDFANVLVGARPLPIDCQCEFHRMISFCDTVVA